MTNIEKMKRSIIIFMIAMMAIIYVPEIFSLSQLENNDSISTTLKLQALQGKRDSLQKKIKEEDSKRNQQIPGVSPERMEEMNDRQDSICLALRSELIDVLLEIKENNPPLNSQDLAVPLTQLLNNQGHTVADSVTNNASKPERKPAKK